MPSASSSAAPPTAALEDELFPNLAARRLFGALTADPAICSAFRVLPDAKVYPEYYLTIARPIALSCMWAAMAAPGHGRYTLADLQRDLRRMVANAKRFNQTESAVYAQALAIERAARKFSKEIEADGMDDEDEDCL